METRCAPGKIEMIYIWNTIKNQYKSDTMRLKYNTKYKYKCNEKIIEGMIVRGL